MCEPLLLIADEPTTALDVTIQAQVLKLLQSLKKKLGITLILITHDLGVVAAVADRVAVMYAGEIVEQAPVRDIFLSPQHPYTRALLRCVPRFDAKHRGEMLGSIPGRVPSLVGQINGCAFADRCDYVFDDCRRSSIPLVALTPAVSSRCLLARSAELAHV
jgi:peptide/nickel transport system ATP-binding protein